MSITMLHKKGDPSNPHNYRPITLVNFILNVVYVLFIEFKNAFAFVSHEIL